MLSVPTLGVGTAGEAKAYLDEFADHVQADELIRLVGREHRIVADV